VATRLVSTITVGPLAPGGSKERDLRDLNDQAGARYLGKDMFLTFFEECYRILRPGATLTIHCPAQANDRAFQDPTHRRFIVANTFAYINRAWREANKLTHGCYDLKCNFIGNVGSPRRC
jgi:hypothetical protein